MAQNSLRHLFSSYSGDQKAFRIGPHEHDGEPEAEEKGDATVEAEVERDPERPDPAPRQAKRPRAVPATSAPSKVPRGLSDRRYEKPQAPPRVIDQPRPRRELPLDYKDLARKFVRSKTEEEIEAKWEREKSNLWLDFKSLRRDQLRGRKHGSRSRQEPAS